mmetsp:Transcript_2676/g.11452  ORF Transcript_2676/g.11452 Transcript_2676/m.11452 type:complete len:299 (+) Transcript_2676:413-1309(+)
MARHDQEGVVVPGTEQAGGHREGGRPAAPARHARGSRFRVLCRSRNGSLLPHQPRNRRQRLGGTGQPPGGTSEPRRAQGDHVHHHPRAPPPQGPRPRRREGSGERALVRRRRRLQVGILRRASAADEIPPHLPARRRRGARRYLAPPRGPSRRRRPLLDPARRHGRPRRSRPLGDCRAVPPAGQGTRARRGRRRRVRAADGVHRPGAGAPRRLFQRRQGSAVEVHVLRRGFRGGGFPGRRGTSRFADAALPRVRLDDGEPRDRGREAARIAGERRRRRRVGRVGRRGGGEEGGRGWPG